MLRIPNAYGHDVEVTLKDGKVLTGFVFDYDNPFENDSGNFSMDLETNSEFCTIDDELIKDIKILA
ncbi:hypothetical protein [Staphylococcus simiae]|uniref:Uncharacterized protein n=1 Tax=Staphylococcus simiae CCM 7213 = CCUG 51256 TaxID=911238 RepID=G5JM10_9STAP|nr:hypothetical protein SS7213T_12667 [Staphylococcus simiae CCM 7213 = CCUG 51256]PNZ10425.1 hypothetical protein CD113_10380 [Staphylococcus simiae]SNV70255.1 Uncharacterised protein [Staphylococcus simiae]